jgi:transcription initiation factor IIF auxiliary subunit
MKMDFKFNNYARLIKTQMKAVSSVEKDKQVNWYEWVVFMDEPADTLKLVKAVEYRLHRSFPDPIRVIDDRDTKFALRASGWGEFSMIVIVYLMNGSEVQTQYFVDLKKPWPTGVN